MRFDLVDIDWKEHLTPLTSNTRGHSCRFWNPYCRTDVYLSTFFPRTSGEWNLLKIDPSDYPTLDNFKVVLEGAKIKSK